MAPSPSDSFEELWSHTFVRDDGDACDTQSQPTLQSPRLVVRKSRSPPRLRESSTWYHTPPCQQQRKSSVATFQTVQTFPCRRPPLCTPLGLRAPCPTCSDDHHYCVRRLSAALWPLVVCQAHVIGYICLLCGSSSRTRVNREGEHTKNELSATRACHRRSRGCSRCWSGWWSGCRRWERWRWF